MSIQIKKTNETKLKMKRENFWKYILISHEKAKNNNEFRPEI